MRELPEGWTSATLKDVLEDFQSEFASGEKDVDGGLKHLRMNNIGVEGKLNLDLLRTVPAALASQRHYLSKGDILFCTTNSAKLVGKCCLFDLDGQFAFSNHLTKLRVNKAIIEKFLLHYIWLLWKQGEFEHKCKHWVNQSTLPKDELLETEVVLPPLNEQRRIVEKLEKLLSRVDAANARLATIPRILKRFRQSVLAAACSGRLTADWREQNPRETVASSFLESTNLDSGLPNTWATTRVGDVINGLKYGTSQKCGYEKRGVPVLRIPNIGDGYIETTDIKYAELPQNEFEQLKLSAGDILLIRSNGSVSLVGKSALVRESEDGFAYAGYLIRLKPNRSHITPEFLNLSLSSHGVRLQIEVPARSTSGVNNINSDEVKALELALPPLTEQQEIVRRVEALFKTADALEARYRTAKAHVDKLTQSILARAFRGELVTIEAELARLEGRDYEPASRLLERIRQERDTDNSRSQPRRQKRAASPSLPY